MGIERIAVAEIIQRVIDAARIYRVSGPDAHSESLFALFEALEALDEIEDQLGPDTKNRAPLDEEPGSGLHKRA